MCFRSIALAVLAVTLPHTAAPDPELGQPFDVKAAAAVTVQGLQITFEGVSEDSRCPRGVQCVWAGDAAATFTLVKPPAAPEQRTLHTSGRFARQADYDSFVVRLEDVKPYPTAGVEIAPRDYLATLVVTVR